MAGSPGAGKTEFSKEYLKLLREDDDNFEVLRIDPDEYRALIPGYTGNNSWLVQAAATVITEKVLDFALKNQQSFLLDGTFSDWPKSRSNIERCLGRNRDVEILYIYQPPEMAWHLVQAREEQEGRMVPFEVFVQRYLGAYQAVKSALTEFGNSIRVDVFIKPIEGRSSAKSHLDVKDLEKVLKIGTTPEEIYERCKQEKS